MNFILITLYPVLLVYKNVTQHAEIEICITLKGNIFLLLTLNAKPSNKDKNSLFAKMFVAKFLAWIDTSFVVAIYNIF